MTHTLWHIPEPTRAFDAPFLPHQHKLLKLAVSSHSCTHKYLHASLNRLPTTRMIQAPKLDAPHVVPGFLVPRLPAVFLQPVFVGLRVCGFAGLPLGWSVRQEWQQTLYRTPESWWSRQDNAILHALHVLRGLQQTSRWPGSPAPRRPSPRRCPAPRGSPPRQGAPLRSARVRHC